MIRKSLLALWALLLVAAIQLPAQARRVALDEP